MNFRELLKKQGLTDDQIKAVVEAMKTEKIYTTKEENIDERYEKLKSQKEDIDSQLKEANTTITDLKKSSKGNEDLQTKIKEYEGTIDTLKKDSDAKIRNLTIDSAIEKALVNSKAKHSDLLSSKFDREKIVISEDGKVTGVDEQLKGLKDSYKDLFEVKVGGVEPNNPEPSPGGANPTYNAIFANADNMTAEQIAEQFTKMKQ